MDIESISVRLLVRKLSFLRLLDENTTGVGAVVIKLLTDELDSLCLVKECRRVRRVRRVGRKLWNSLYDTNDADDMKIIVIVMTHIKTPHGM